MRDAPNPPSPDDAFSAKPKDPACPRCRAKADQADCYCRHCGRALRPRTGFWYGNAGILLLTLIVGPFSLISVWLSRTLSLRAKTLWTVCIALFSAYFLFAAYRSYLLLKETVSYMLPAGL